MENIFCPYCKEEIKAEAVLCKHCRSSLPNTPAQMLMAEMTEQEVQHIAFKKSISDAEAFCYFKFGSNKVALQECLDNAKAVYMIKVLKERLQRELNLTMHDIIWGGGDIDPLELEKEVRKRFSYMPDR